MKSILKELLEWFLSSSIKKVLFGAGLTLSSSAISLSVVNYYINKLMSYLSSINFSMTSLFGILGLDVAFNVIISAYVVKFTLKSSQVFLSKLS